MIHQIRNMTLGNTGGGTGPTLPLEFLKIGKIDY